MNELTRESVEGFVDCDVMGDIIARKYAEYGKRLAQALLRAWNANEDMRDVVFAVNEDRDKLFDALAKMLTCFGRDSNGVLWACPIDSSKDPPVKVECDNCPNLKEAREILRAKALPKPTEET